MRRKTNLILTWSYGYPLVYLSYKKLNWNEANISKYISQGTGRLVDW